MSVQNLFPQQVVIIGGGRWSRVIAKTACSMAPADMKITLCSWRGFNELKNWVARECLCDRVRIVKSKSDCLQTGFGAVIVANAANDHKDAALWAIKQRLPVLIEKPFVSKFEDAQVLETKAKNKGVLLAASNVFLFANYLKTFSNSLPKLKDVHSINFEWADAEGENRYGETKSFDSSIPVFIDCLPHIMSVLKNMFGIFPRYVGIKDVKLGGSSVRLEMSLNETLCSVLMERNAAERRRFIEVHSSSGVRSLDFTSEPGLILTSKTSYTADSDWDTREAPLARMLRAFFAAACGAKVDNRLGLQPAFRACEVADVILPMYRERTKNWLKDRLRSSKAWDGALEYALAERLQKRRRLAHDELESRKTVLRSKCYRKHFDN